MEVNSANENVAYTVTFYQLRAYAVSFNLVTTSADILLVCVLDFERIVQRNL